jgi:DNA-binding response OmpR family regulator
MKTVLIVDDSAMVRLACEAILEDFGFEVSGVDSLAKARPAIERRYDVVVLDLNLPDGRGIDLVPDLRARHPTTAIVVLTGEVGLEIPEVDDVIVKGGDPSALRKQLDDAIARAQARG